MPRKLSGISTRINRASHKNSTNMLGSATPSQLLIAFVNTSLELLAVAYHICTQSLLNRPFSLLEPAPRFKQQPRFLLAASYPMHRCVLIESPFPHRVQNCFPCRVQTSPQCSCFVSLGCEGDNKKNTRTSCVRKSSLCNLQIELYTSNLCTATLQSPCNSNHHCSTT